ncbi:MAG TPA: amino acid ABC transporter substrate-binding protein [Stellaceae bacterium]|nr:amino acid ABC transporter substrate-binding protein [Stellaceae bacterium]
MLWRTKARLALAAMLLAAVLSAAPAQAADPIKIGFSVSLTGGVAANGKQVLLAMQIWRDDINAKGGLLGRPVEFVYYDDQSSPSTVPGIYTKLIEIDKVDLTVGPYATNMVVPALLVLMQHKMVTLGILAMGANREFHYPKYFAMISSGPQPMLAFSEGFFAVAVAQNPKPKTVAIVAADAEFAKVSSEGARVNAKKAGLEIVYDKTYPPNTTDYAPIIRAIQATGPDIVYNAGYPPDTIGMVRAAHEVGLKTMMFGGNMIGLLATTFRVQLGPLLNGIVSTADVFVPAPSFDFPGVQELLRKYQARAPAEGIDPLGYNFAPFGYAAVQVLGEAVEGAKTLDQDKLGEYMHGHSFDTVVGTIAYGPDGEWTKARVLVSQFQHVTGNDPGQFKDMTKQVIVWPPEYKSGNLIWPYTEALK